MSALLDDLANQQADIFKKLSDAQDKLTWLNQQYSIDHYGGQSPSQFAEIVRPVQSTVSDYGSQLTQLQLKIQQQQSLEASVNSTYTLSPVPTVSPTAAPTPAAAEDILEKVSTIFKDAVGAINAQPVQAIPSVITVGGGDAPSPAVPLLIVGAGVVGIFLFRKRLGF